MGFMTTLHQTMKMTGARPNSINSIFNSILFIVSNNNRSYLRTLYRYNLQRPNNFPQASIRCDSGEEKLPFRQKPWTDPGSWWTGVCQFRLEHTLIQIYTIWFITIIAFGMMCHGTYSNNNDSKTMTRNNSCASSGTTAAAASAGRDIGASSRNGSLLTCIKMTWFDTDGEREDLSVS